MTDNQLNWTNNALCHKIDEWLDNDEREIIFFLCQDVIPLCQASDDMKNTLENILFLKNGDIFCLAELMFIIKRYDIIKRVLNLDINTVKSHIGNKIQITSPYRMLMVSISEQLDSRDVKGLCFISKGTVYCGFGENVSFLKLVLKMEKHGILQPPSGLEKLICMLASIHRLDLSKRVKDFRDSMVTE
ncbi:v-FLIP [Vespertilionid gammaherpesvirus 1]|uniref:V-FLIP n=1 Tax=Vespertilionid gammaherpesvirus 1 TaxID=2560830 RepID=A0A0X9Y7F7_9GAMA|nr:v-FLIP [Myotis gammaherpesvirus 8]AMA67354.1 v-FLIP [Vespertilionid gammaherpesvirus 1]